MVLFTLINVPGDIYFNIAWWLITKSCKYTLYGTYYLITYIIPPKEKITKEELELIELKNEIQKLNRKMHFTNYILNINNNPNIITRNQLMLHNSSSIEEIDDDFDLELLDEFVVFNNDDTIAEI